MTYSQDLPWRHSVTLLASFVDIDTTIPTIPASSTAEVQAVINDDGMIAAQPFITSLAFTFIPSTTLVVEAGDTVPSGEAVLELTVRIQATVDPTK